MAPRIPERPGTPDFRGFPEVPTLPQEPVPASDAADLPALSTSPAQVEPVRREPVEKPPGDVEVLEWKPEPPSGGTDPATEAAIPAQPLRGLGPVGTLPRPQESVLVEAFERLTGLDGAAGSAALSASGLPQARRPDPVPARRPSEDAPDSKATPVVESTLADRISGPEFARTAKNWPSATQAGRAFQPLATGPSAAPSPKPEAPVSSARELGANPAQPQAEATVPQAATEPGEWVETPTATDLEAPPLGDGQPPGAKPLPLRTPAGARGGRSLESAPPKEPGTPDASRVPSMAFNGFQFEIAGSREQQVPGREDLARRGGSTDVPTTFPQPQPPTDPVVKRLDPATSEGGQASPPPPPRLDRFAELVDRKSVV